MIVLLASYPRSGSTFLRHVIETMYGHRALSIYGNDENAVTGRAVMWQHDDPDRGEQLVFVKTHRGQDARLEHPAIYLVRDGLDAIRSHAEYESTDGLVAPGEPIGGIADRLARGDFPCSAFGDPPWHWSNHVIAWSSRPAQTVLVRFEDLVAYPKRAVRAAIAELGLGLEERVDARLLSLAELHDRAPTYFRSPANAALVGLSEPVVAAFKRTHGAVYRTLGYESTKVQV